MAAAFLDETQATHLLFMDADIGFAPDQVFRLLNFDADVAAAAYPTRQLNWRVLAKLLRKGPPTPEAASFNYVLGVDLTEAITARDGFANVHYAGTGFLMVRRDAPAETVCRAPGTALPESAGRRRPATRQPAS